MKVEMNRKFPRQLLMDRDVEEHALVPEAIKVRDRLRAGTRRGRTKRTAMSTRIEIGHLSAARDRRAVRVYQTHGAVPMNFRTNVDYMYRLAKGG